MTVEAWKNGSVTRHTADLMVPVRTENSVMIQLRGDSRRLSEIAADFEGLDEISTDDGREITDCADPIVVYRVDADTVQIRIGLNT